MNQSNPGEEEGVVNQFIEVTGVDRERARFFLSSAAFDLPLALSTFFEGGGADEIDEADPEIIFDDPPAAAAADDEGRDEIQIIDQPGSNSVDMSTGAGGGGGGKKPGEDPKKKIATIFSKSGGQQQQGGARGGEEDSSSDEDEKGQAFYVGGSDKSGQQVLGPPKKGGASFVDKFFKKTQERGAEVLDPTQRAQASSAAAGSSGAGTFSGAGYRLGDAVQPAEKIGGDSPGADVSPDQRSSSVTVVMRMWRNGFTLGDDGPLRTLDGPEDRQFLQHIMEGRLPPELVQAHRGRQIDLEMEDHRGEEYKPPKNAIKAFTGQGHTLGSPVPQVVGAGKVGEKVPPTGAASAAAAENGPAPQVQQPPVDESKPITNIQVRLGNGERLTLKLNIDNTIRDLRGFICQMRPDLAAREFILMTSFPSKELTDESSTLEEAKLLNAVIIQRFK